MMGVKMRLRIVGMTGLLILAGCASRRMRVDVGAYSFEYQNQMYSIESVTPNFAEGYNVLLGKEDKRIVFRAVDREQDGVLDEVTRGKLTLREANLVYAEGIRIGKLRGFVRKRNFTRSYQTRIRSIQVTVATYLLALGDTYNKFIVRTTSFDEVIALDSDADGRLDGMESGGLSPEEYQGMYEEVIEKGLKEGRIERMEGMVIVLE